MSCPIVCTCSAQTHVLYSVCAAAAVAGKHDHVISVAEAKTILAEALDGGVYTNIEKDTMAYIRSNYKWTDAADDYTRKAVASWAAKKVVKKKKAAAKKKAATKKKATKKN